MLNSFADVGQQGHESGAFHGDSQGSLEGGTGATSLPAIELALRGAELFEIRHIFVIDEGRSRATFLRAESTTTSFDTLQFLPNHRGLPFPYQYLDAGFQTEVIQYLFFGDRQLVRPFEAVFSSSVFSFQLNTNRNSLADLN